MSAQLPECAQIGPPASASELKSHYDFIVCGSGTRTRGQLMRNSFWNSVAVKLISAGISAGYSVVGLLDSGCDRLASYVASRSVALLISTLIRAWARRGSRTAITNLQ
jgi:hypothetical protein